KAASGRRDRKNGDAEEKHAPASEEIAHRPADQNQRAEEQSIAFDDPLHVDDCAAERFLNGGEGGVHDGAVDEGHAGAKDGDGEDPGLGGLGAGNGGMGGLYYRFVAGWLHGFPRAITRTPNYTVGRAGVNLASFSWADREERKGGRRTRSPIDAGGAQ